MKDYKTRSQHNFDRQAERYDASSFGVHARKLHPLLLRQLAQIPHERVLDVGCGTGALLEQISSRWPGGTYSGVDLSPRMAAAARAKLRERAHIVPGDAEALPFPDSEFQVVMCCDSFHHYPHPELALREMYRVLEPGGVLLLADTTAPTGARALINLLLPMGHGGDVRLYSTGELVALLSPLFHGVECHKVDHTSLLVWGIR
mgnify:CR=1 FL=1